MTTIALLLLALTANPIPKTPQKLPERLPEGVYRIGGCEYKLSWTGPVLLVEPTGDIGPWNGEGRMIDGKLEVRWQYVDGRPAVGTYTLSADRRSAAGYWQWVGDETQLPESITPPAERGP